MFDIGNITQSFIQSGLETTMASLGQLLQSLIEIPSSRTEISQGTDILGTLASTQPVTEYVCERKGLTGFTSPELPPGL